MGSNHEEDAYALMTQLGREVFMLGFKVSFWRLRDWVQRCRKLVGRRGVAQVRWPMNVVVTTHSMNTYQLIFRHLLELKCVERELNKVWKVYQRARSITG